MNISLLSGSGHLSTVITLCKSLKIIELLGKKLIITVPPISYKKNELALDSLGLNWDKKVTQNACLSNFKEAQEERNQVIQWL